MKAYKKTVKRVDMYKQFLVLINYLLDLTDREIEVLALLMHIQLEQKLILNKPNDILSTDNRRMIMAETLLNKNNLSKYVMKMKDLDIILKDENGHYINSMFIPDVKDDETEILFILNIENE
jgi:hypothetical protein